MPISAWVIFNILVLLVLGLDLFVFRRNERVIRTKEALLWTGFWITVALLFSLYIYFYLGSDKAEAFLAGYLIEKSLSMDNLFVFLLIFNYFRTPRSCYHKVLFWGILGAIIFRATFIFLGIALINLFHPLIYLFGVFLVITGIRFAVKEKTIEPEKNIVFRFFRKIFRVTEDYERDKFFVWRNTKLWVTPLWIVLLCIETSDIVFAVDSIPAIFAITLDPFIVYTSNILAILGLRALFFVLSSLVEAFKYLHYGIAAILIFVGLKMLVSDIIHIQPFVALGVILLILFVAMICSWISNKKEAS